MRNKTFTFIAVIITCVLASCKPVDSDQAAKTSSGNAIQVASQTRTLTQSPSQTTTATLEATLTAGETDKAMREFLSETSTCRAPCLFGIQPGETTLAQAKAKFTQMGLDPYYSNVNGKEHYSFSYNWVDGPDVAIILGFKNSVVQDINFEIDDWNSPHASRQDWQAFSPAAMIEQYGIPTRVEFAVGRVNPISTYGIVVLFENSNMVYQYSSSEMIGSIPGIVRVCPMTDESYFANILIGDFATSFLGTGIPLDQATSLTMEEFSKILTGPPNEACFDLIDAVFP